MIKNNCAEYWATVSKIIETGVISKKRRPWVEGTDMIEESMIWEGPSNCQEWNEIDNSEVQLSDCYEADLGRKNKEMEGIVSREKHSWDEKNFDYISCWSIKRDANGCADWVAQ